MEEKFLKVAYLLILNFSQGEADIFQECTEVSVYPWI